MKPNRTFRATAWLLFTPLSLFPVFAAAQSPGWLPPQTAGVTVTAQPDGNWHLTSPATGDYSIESAESLPAKPGGAFALKVRIQVGLDMNALPELVCYDAQGRELPIPSSLLRGNRFATTNWQSFDRVFPAQPNTASVRARIRARGRGTIKIAGLSLQPTKIDSYQTGALIAQPHAKTRVDVVLESNFGIQNPQVITTADRDGDGKWALVTVNLDKLTAPEKKGEDWRSNFEDNPNAILWSDGAVLKSDSVRENRVPDRARALHYRTRVHAGPYVARISDPGRPVAVSVDGTTWRRCDPGEEIALGTLPMADGVLEFWLDACYVDAVTPGPAYFDYVRLTPTMHAPDIERIFAAARVKAPPLARGTVDERKVLITVDAPVFAGSRSWPVRCGLPVPRGDLVSAENVAVLNAAGATLPSQCRVTATWPDGSVKWLFVDYMHDPSTGERGQYSVAYGHRVKTASAARVDGVQVQRRAGGLEVDTGALRFFISSSHFGFIENVRTPDGRQVQREPIGSEIAESGGRTWRALELPVTKLEVEQAGPLHTVVLVETKLAASGQPSTGFYHRARIHAYAGSPLVHVDYFVANTDSRPAKDVGGSMSSKVVVKSFSLHVRPAQVVTGAISDAGPAPTSGARVQKTERLALDVRAQETKESAARVAGWVGLSLEGGGTLQAGVADFREQFPKALRWQPEGLAIDLWAAEAGDFDWIEGVGKTHHLALFYGTGAPMKGELLTKTPLLATATPEWYVRSGAFGEIETAAGSGLPAVERTLAAYMKNPVIERVGLGFENYGDHMSPGGYVKGHPLWDNNEYDLPAACMVHFARTGDRDALRLGLASALHYVDVDTIHYSSQRAEWARAHHTHSHGLFGHHTAQGPDFGHASNAQGLLWYSYLTGDPAGKDGARGIADWCLSKLGLHTSGMERVLAHPLMTLNDVYEATGEEKYLRGSAHLVDQAFKWEHPVRGGFLSPITESPAYYSGSSFNNGLVSAGLLKFNRWALLPEIDSLLERFARWTLADVWVAPHALATKGGSPNKGGNAQFISTHARMMAHVYERTKDPLYLVVPWKLTTAGFGENTKPIPGTRSVGMVYNYLPWLLAALREHGNPEPEPQFEVVVSSPAVTLAPGAATRVSFTIKNAGTQPIEDLRGSFHSRLDFAIATTQPPPVRLLPGETAECWYDVRAPRQINLSCAYNAIAYAHWSVLYRRIDRAHLAHRVVNLNIAGTPISAMANGSGAP
ncbi:MAG: hypothetical protein Q7S40_21555 [Opitutaceae bacterium]|nr:hypothetical protein [Opitutaceae bacterium]